MPIYKGSVLVGGVIPDYSKKIDLGFSKTFTNAGEEKTMSASGQFVFSWLTNANISTLYFYVNNVHVCRVGNDSGKAFWSNTSFTVGKGDVVKVVAEVNGGYTATGVLSYLFPFKWQ